MKRPWQIWLALAACGAVVSAAMAWLTVHALQADRERTAARAAADLEQKISLSLWRMDTKLAPLIAEESARPHFYYAPIITVGAPAAKGEVVEGKLASPLMTRELSNVILNFDASPGGQWQSPQAPPPELTDFACSNGMTVDQIGSNRARLNELAASIDVNDLLAQLPKQPLPSYDAPNVDAERAAALDAIQQSTAPPTQPFYGNYSYAEPNASGDGGLSRGGTTDEFAQAGRVPAQFGASPGGKAAAPMKSDLGDRNLRVQQQVGQEFIKQRRDNVYLQSGGLGAPGTSRVVENVSRPLWVGNELLLARRVVRDGTTFVQGSWLNWPQLKAELLAETEDLLPGADLTPVRPGEEADPTRMLAGLPVRLMASVAPAGTNGASPLRWALGVGWTALLLALLAVAGLLRGVLALSERRAAFVSSVTHELRTPLTTFRMYAELLVRDMAPTPERRREYLQTLRTEAERLTHLVDNVLAYARLERGRKPRRAERTTPASLVERFESRLADRASQAEMTLECTVDAAAAKAALLTDVGVVEQIVFNLVDNAAKYAGRATDRRIHLHAHREGDFVLLTVRDHGPGFASLREAERSAPFSKSAVEAAETAPGVGLGLALCRRLARELGGRLEIASAADPTGGSVTLRLPIED
jgi:signal transduction histidine kinase